MTRPHEMSVRSKLTATIALGCALFVGFTWWVMRLQYAGFERAAELETTHLATAIAHGAATRHGSLQQYVDGLDALYKRDIVVVDAGKHIVADIAPEIGQLYAEDKLDEVSRTLRDGKSRTFVEVSAQHPDGASQTVVALRRDGLIDGPITGAVVLESSNIARELREAGLTQIHGIVAGGLFSTLLVAFFGFRLGKSIADRLGSLSRGVAEVANGRYDIRLPVDSGDEIGLLQSSFNDMARDLGASRDQLLVEIDKQKAAAAQIEHLAYHDTLTGLANRALFSRLLCHELAKAQRYGTSLAVMFVDLDRFKNINDTLGHEAGDALLKEVARRLKSTVRNSDVVARQGGDEFTVLLPNSDDPDALATVAEKVLGAIALPYVSEGHEFRVTASVGISSFPRDGIDERTLMKRADIAMYQAKEEGKNTFAFYSSESDHHSVERLVFESSLRQALEQGQFAVHYQPKVSGTTGRITGVEALLRWHHPDLGLVPPAKFIPVAEETGLIVPIGRWVLQTACAQQVAWCRAGLEPMRMAVNLSARQLDDDGLVGDVRTIIEATGIDPASLEIEITESMLMRDVEKASVVLGALKALGLWLSVDDFGTGYSSLSTLKRFPVDAIKVDRSFVRDLATGTGDRAMADAIIAMGRGLGMSVIAEGVETGDQAAFLRQRGCDELQGFYYSKAVSERELQTLLEAHPGGILPGRDVAPSLHRGQDSAFLVPA